LTTLTKLIELIELENHRILNQSYGIIRSKERYVHKGEASTIIKKIRSFVQIFYLDTQLYGSRS